MFEFKISHDNVYFIRSSAVKSSAFRQSAVKQVVFFSFGAVFPRVDGINL